jgi:hypothetical protein
VPNAQTDVQPGTVILTKGRQQKETISHTETVVYKKVVPNELIVAGNR